MSTSEVAARTLRVLDLPGGDSRGVSTSEGALPTLGALLDQAPCAMILLDAGGDIVFANRRMGELFGLEPSSAVGRRLSALIPDAARLAPVFGRLTDHHSHFQPADEACVTLTGRRTDGSEFPADLHLSAIRHGTRSWALAVLRDATEQCRKLEHLAAARRAAEEVARAKGEFLSLAAHDLIQPVQALELAIDAIGKKTREPAAVPDLTAARVSVDRMRELLKMLLEISRIESGKVRVDEQPVQVSEMLEYLERQFGTTARAKGLVFRCDSSRQVVQTDATLLRGVLSNLIGNAIRYTPSGEVRVRARLRAGGTLCLEVSDTGIGIESGELERIFEDFHRLDEARRATPEGFGLGLGVVRRLSGLLGLPVTARSTVGRGSTFSIEFPPCKVLDACAGLPVRGRRRDLHRHIGARGDAPHQPKAAR